MNDRTELKANETKLFHQEQNFWGLMSTLDLKKCSPKIIRSSEEIRKYVIELCNLIDMKRYGDVQIVHFGEDEKVAGYSMTQLIETSLISGHFVNLTNDAYIDIFSCKFYDPEKAADFTKTYFGAEKINFSVIYR